ncbi:MAG TPA: pyridoxamine 5'-phosphate oxidase family protein [Terracidiphilus sp.]|nr:pyridoxamine 5'-phosphate oxidase family protein [Terracidiphilus sp.]
MDKTAMYAFLCRSRYGVLSYLSPAGTPRSALVGVATTHEFEIVFDTVKTSRKYGDLRERPCCSIVLWPGGEQTVQLEGTAFEPEGADREGYREAYFAVWPDGRHRLSWPGLTHFVVRPRWIRCVDYDRSPPLIEEVRFPG